MVHKEHQRLHHQHNHIHKRQIGQAIDQVAGQVETVVTEVVQTVSVVQQIDTNGNILGLLTLFPTTTALSSVTFPTPPVVDVASKSSDVASLVPSPGASTATPIPSSSSTESLPLQSLQSTSSDGLEPLTTTLISPTSLPTISTSTSLSITISNRTVSGSPTTSIISSSTSSTLSSFANSTVTSTSTDVFTTTSTDSLSPTSTEEFIVETKTLVVLGGPGGLGTGAPAASTPTSQPTAGGVAGNTDPTAPSTPIVVGSVVGSLAGVALILFAVLYLLRWKKRRLNVHSLGSGDADPVPGAAFAGAAPSRGGGMAERALPFTVPAALAGLAGYKNKRASANDSVAHSSTAGSERGFYRVSGRKIQSVLETGGDGYGGSVGAGAGAPDSPTNTHLSGTSFYRDSQGFYGGSGVPVSPPFAPSPEQYDGGFPIMRPSPARTPVTTQAPFAPPIPPPGSPRRPDAVGRSHPSHDGSHGSKFTEQV